MKKKFLFLAVILLTYPAVAQERRFIIPLEDSPAQGPADAPVTIVEFIDFQ